MYNLDFLAAIYHMHSRTFFYLYHGRYTLLLFLTQSLVRSFGVGCCNLYATDSRTRDTSKSGKQTYLHEQPASFYQR